MGLSFKHIASYTPEAEPPNHCVISRHSQTHHQSQSHHGKLPVVLVLDPAAQLQVPMQGITKCFTCPYPPHSDAVPNNYDEGVTVL